MKDDEQMAREIAQRIATDGVQPQTLDELWRCIRPTDVDELTRLLLWAREHGFRIGPELHVGGIRLLVTDLRQPNVEAVLGGTHPTEPTLEQQFGIPNDAAPEGTMP